MLIFWPGLFFVLPAIDKYSKVDLRTVSFDVPPQEVHIFIFIRYIIIEIITLLLFSTRLLWLSKCSKLKTSFDFTNSNHTRGARYFPSLIRGVTTIIRRTCAPSRSLELLLKCSIAARFSLCQALSSFHSVFYSRSAFPTILEPETG